MTTVIDYFVPGESGYSEGSIFATETYSRKLSMTITRFPDFLFVARKQGAISGCIGLNDRIHNPVFTRDNVLVRALQMVCADEGRVGEQYLWATDRHPLTSVMLISVLSAFSATTHLSHVIFTGTTLSLRAMRQIGAHPVILGPLRPDFLDTEDRMNCAKWFSVYKDALACVQETAPMRALNERMFREHGHAFTLGPNINAALHNAKDATV